MPPLYPTLFGSVFWGIFSIFFFRFVVRSWTRGSHQHGNVPLGLRSREVGPLGIWEKIGTRSLKQQGRACQKNAIPPQNRCQRCYTQAAPRHTICIVIYIYIYILRGRWRQRTMASLALKPKNSPFQHAISGRFWTKTIVCYHSTQCTHQC